MTDPSTMKSCSFSLQTFFYLVRPKNWTSSVCSTSKDWAVHHSSFLQLFRSQAELLTWHSEQFMNRIYFVFQSSSSPPHFPSAAISITFGTEGTAGWKQLSFSHSHPAAHVWWVTVFQSYETVTSFCFLMTPVDLLNRRIKIWDLGTFEVFEHLHNCSLVSIWVHLME